MAQMVIIMAKMVVMITRIRANGISYNDGLTVLSGAEMSYLIIPIYNMVEQRRDISILYSVILTSSTYINEKVDVGIIIKGVVNETYFYTKKIATESERV